MGSDVVALVDLGWKLLLVLGLAVVAIRALRWLGSPTLNGDRALKVVSRLPIGPQQSVLILAVGDKRLLVGQSPNAINVLAELPSDQVLSDDLTTSGTDDQSRSPDQGLPTRRIDLASLISRGLHAIGRGGE